MELTVDKRESLIELLVSEYTIPEEYIECIKVAVKQYATKNYSDEAIEKMVRTPQSLSKGLVLLRERNGKNDLSLFRGIISEWLVCAEYNALKNKGSVIMTITNPDPSSKADLLHIINTGKGYKAVPGPDVKSGGSTYVFNQWKKIVNERYEIPMVDIDGILTSEEGLKQLTQKQRAEFDELCRQFPSKRPLETVFDKSDINRVIADYLKYVEFDLLPSSDSKLSVKDINTVKIKEKLYSGTISNKQTHDWSVYAKESKDVLGAKNVQSDIKCDKPKREVTLPKQNISKTPKQVVEPQKGFFQSMLGEGKKIIKQVGTTIRKSGSTVLKFAAENPEIVETLAVGIIGLIASNSGNSENNESEQGSSYSKERNTIYYDDFNSDFEYDLTNGSSNSTPLETNFSHNYPEERKGPRAHPYRRNGVVVGARGGTEEERAAIRKEYGIE